MYFKQSLTVGLVVILLVFISCTTEETTIINSPITDTCHLKGTVRAWRCGIFDLWNNPRNKPELLRFSVCTGEPATVTLIRDNGFETIIDTDDSSDFDLYVSAGSHMAIVETGYTYPPDTFYNIQLKPGDTSLTLDIVYDVVDPLNIDFVYSYPTMDDTLGAEYEWNIFWQLNGLTRTVGIPLMLDILRSMPADTFRVSIYESYSGTVYITHRVPIRREYPGYGKLYNVLEVWEKLREAAEADTTSLIPPGFSLHPSGGYACLD